MPGLTIRDDLPNLPVETNHGKMKLHDYVGDSYTILFSHPGDFTPVCTTELAMMAALASSLREELNLWDFLVIMFSHIEWIKDIEAYNKVAYPIIADLKRELIKQLRMVDPDETDSSGNKLPSCALHIVGPDKKAVAPNWKPGEPVVIAPGVSNEEARRCSHRVLTLPIFRLASVTSASPTFK